MAARRRKAERKALGKTANKERLATKPENSDKEKAELSTFEYVKLFSTLIGAFIFSCFCTLLIWYIFLRETLPMEYIKLTPVEVGTLPQPNTPFVNNVVDSGKPVIIRNSFVTQWNALKSWSPEYLLSKEREISGVYQNDNKWFGPYYDETKPMNEFTTRINKYKTNIDMSAKQFVTLLRSPAPNQYMYYTGNIDQFNEWALADISPYQELLTPNPSHSSINVWIGQPKVTAHCHYDGYHNFYAQLYGRKRFILFNPASFTELYPYPFLHPSHAQAQVNFSSYDDLDLYPSVKNAVAFEAVLNPGDLLYVPPLWYHHVEAIDVSMSVNVWTDTHQTEIMESIFRLPLPINKIKWNGENLKAIGSSFILYHTVKRVCETAKCPTPSVDSNDGSSPSWTSDKYLVYRVWNTRYRVLMENSSVLSNQFTALQHRKSLVCENNFLPDLFYQGIQQKIDRSNLLDDYLSSVPPLVAQLPEGTWETWFANYIEYIAYNSVPVKYVGLFLKYYDSCIGQFKY